MSFPGDFRLHAEPFRAWLEGVNKAELEVKSDSEAPGDGEAGNQACPSPVWDTV